MSQFFASGGQSIGVSVGRIDEELREFRAEIKEMVGSSTVEKIVEKHIDALYRSTPGLPVHHQLPEFTQTHVH